MCPFCLNKPKVFFSLVSTYLCTKHNPKIANDFETTIAQSTLRKNKIQKKNFKFVIVVHHTLHLLFYLLKSQSKTFTIAIIPKSSAENSHDQHVLFLRIFIFLQSNNNFIYMSQFFLCIGRWWYIYHTYLYDEGWYGNYSMCNSMQSPSRVISNRIESKFIK